MGDVLEFSAPKIIAMLIAIAATITTIVRLIEAYADSRAAKLAVQHGARLIPPTRRLLLGSIRREWIRLSKHLILIASIIRISPGAPYPDLGAIGLAAVAAGLALNSILDQIDQRAALRWRGIIPPPFYKPERKR